MSNLIPSIQVPGDPDDLNSEILTYAEACSLENTEICENYPHISIHIVTSALQFFEGYGYMPIDFDLHLLNFYYTLAESIDLFSDSTIKAVQAFILSSESCFEAEMNDLASNINSLNMQMPTKAGRLDDIVSMAKPVSEGNRKKFCYFVLHR